MKLPKFCTFTQPEIDFLIANCNFTDKELQYLLLKQKDKTNVQVAMTMNISESNVSYVAKKVKKKVFKLLPYISRETIDNLKR